MYLKLEICIPYSLREIFDKSVSKRLTELRAEALKACNENRKEAWDYILKPRKGWGEGMDEKSLFEQSIMSAEQHQKAMDKVRQGQYYTYT